MMDDYVRICVGCWRVAPGSSVLLQPDLCGVVGVGAGSLWAGGTMLRVGDSLRLWRRDQVRLQNLDEEAPAEFSWTYCKKQPSWRASARAAMAWVIKSWGVGEENRPYQ
ncbi:hypothetical protein D3C71_919040 [compost metagenome]|jgi:hypothetical protein